MHRSDIKRPPVRVFVSSTFSDMHAERDHLVAVVFPELRERIERIGLEFFDVDLRWGVPMSTVDGERANPWEYCKRWIDRVEPFFICLLGERYGYVPDEGALLDPVDRVRWHGLELSITEMEVRHAVLEREIDSRSSYFYVRNTPVPGPGNIPERVHRAYVDGHRRAHLRDLKARLLTCGRPVRHYDCVWNHDHFEHLEDFGNMVLEDLWSGVLRDVRYVPKSAWRKVLPNDPDRDPLYTDILRPVPPAIADRVADSARPAPPDASQREAAAMAAFAAGRRRWYCGRDGERAALLRYVRAEATTRSRASMCVVSGPHGLGKSALLAHVAEELRGAGETVIEHYVGATESSADVRLLLLRLLNASPDNVLIRGPQTWEQHDDWRLSIGLENMRSDVRDGTRLIIIIDGLERLTNGGDLGWLPHTVSSSVRMIVSCGSEAPVDPCSSAPTMLERLLAHASSPIEVRLQGLSAEDVRRIAMGYLDGYCKQLDESSLQLIAAMAPARNPLYLRVLLDQLRVLGGDDICRHVPAIIAQCELDHGDSVSLFDWVLQRTEVFGRDAVGTWCTSLLLARSGLPSSALQGILKKRHAAAGELAAPRIERALREYLQRHTGATNFFYDELKEAAKRRYQNPEEGPAIEGATLHRDIAAALAGRWTRPDVHALAELTYHLALAGMWNEFDALLANPEYILRKILACGIRSLLADFDCLLESAPAAQLNPFRRQWFLAARTALDLSRRTLEDDPAQVAGQLCGRLQGEGLEDWAPALDAIAQLQSHSWLRPLSGTLHRANGSLEREFDYADGHAAVARIATDGRTVFVGTSTGALEKWNLRSGALESRFGGRHRGAVTTMCVTSNRRRVVTGASDGSIKVWDLELGAEVSALPGHTTRILALMFTANESEVFAGAADGTLRRWSLATGLQISRLCGLSTAVRAMAVTPDGRWIVCGLKDGQLKIVQRRTGWCWRTYQTGTAPVDALAVLGDGRTVAVALGDGALQVRSMRSGRALCTLPGHGIRTTALAVAGDGVRVLAVASDRSLKCWDWETGETHTEIVSNSWTPTDVTVAPDGARAITVARSMKAWSLAHERGFHRSARHGGTVTAVALSRDQRFAVSASEDGTLKVWSPRAGQLLRTLSGHEGDVRAVAIATDSICAVSGADDGTLRVWDLECGREMRRLAGHTARIGVLALTPDGQSVISSAHDGTLRVWNLGSGREEQMIGVGNDQVCALVVSRDGLRVLSGVECGRVVEWEISSGRALRHAFGELLSAVALPDGERVLALRRSGELSWRPHFWSVADMKGGLVFDVEGSPFCASMAVASDRGLVISSSANRLSVWDPDGPRFDPVPYKGGLVGTAVIPCHAQFDVDAWVHCCVASSDGRLFVAGDALGAVHFLRLEQ